MNLPPTEMMVIAILLTNAILLLFHLTWKAQIRAEHLRTALTATNDFYDRAQLLLSDPATPAILKDMIFDIGLAVSNEQAGRKAVALLLKSLGDMRHGGRIPQPKKEILDLLDGLRRSRGDLYDAFHEALGAAFTAILLAYGLDVKRSKMALSYNASGSNRSRLLGLAESIDSVISGWHEQGGGQWTAIA